MEADEHRSVRGNNDRQAWARALPETEAVEVGGVWLYVLHHLHELVLAECLTWDRTQRYKRVDSDAKCEIARRQMTLSSYRGWFFFYFTWRQPGLRESIVPA